MLRSSWCQSVRCCGRAAISVPAVSVAVSLIASADIRFRMFVAVIAPASVMSPVLVVSDSLLVAPYHRPNHLQRVMINQSEACVVVNAPSVPT